MSNFSRSLSKPAVTRVFSLLNSHSVHSRIGWENDTGVYQCQNIAHKLPRGTHRFHHDSNRLWRTLSAFNPSTRRWAPISSRSSQRPTTQRLSLTSWNIDAFSPRAVSRAKLILSHILEGTKSSDIIFLQEVTREVHASILDDARVRDAFMVTDAEDPSSFQRVPFATMTLLSRTCFASSVHSKEEGDGGNGGEKFMFGQLSRMSLPSKYGRDALCVDIAHPTESGTVFRLINVHLDSLGDTLHYRTQQLKILSGVLREPGCSGGIIAGDFNAISAEDAELIDKNELVDAWVALHGKAHPDNGATWGVGVERQDGFGPKRLDKVAMLGVTAEEMEIVPPGLIEVPRPGEESIEIPWSDHRGLRCTLHFNI